MGRVAKALLNVMRIEVLLGIGLVMWVISIEATAQDLVEFKNGQVADAEKLNQNFATLAARIQSESGGEPLYTWLGYTPTSLDSFRRDNELPLSAYYEQDDNTPITQYLATAHCKSVFGPSAFVATNEIIEYLLMVGNSFYPPEEPGAIVFNSSYGTGYVGNISSLRLRVDGNYREPPNNLMSVACVKITGLP